MSHCPSCGFNDDDEWDEIRAEVARLTDENRKMNATIASDALEIAELKGRLREIVGMCDKILNA